MLPAIYSIVAPSPVDAQSLPAVAPTLTSLSPNQGSLGTTVAVTLTGTNFVVGATTVTVNSGGVTATNVVVSSATSLTANIVIDAAATPGAHTVTVTTAGGTSARANLHGQCAASPTAPTLTSVAPNQGIPGSHGGGHADGHQLRRRRHDGGRQRCRRDGQQRRRRQHDVADRQLRDRSGRRRWCAHGDGHDGRRHERWADLHDQSAGAERSDADERLAESRDPGRHGAGHADGHQLRRRRHDGDRQRRRRDGHQRDVSSRTSLTANFVLDPTAATGARAVTVTTAGGTSGAQIFTVNPPAPAAPTLTSVVPNQGIQGTTVAVTLTGTNLVIGATAVIVDGGGVTVTNIIVGSSTSLTANFALDPTATVGARMVTVTTVGGTSGGQTFTINPPQAPTLTSVSPNEGFRGTTVAVTLTGTNFIVGATTVLVGGGDVRVTDVTVISGTSLIATFVIDVIPIPFGSRTVTVTTAGGTSGAQTFTVSPLSTGVRTFNYTGSPEIFTVPTGVFSIRIGATGAQGGIGFGNLGGGGGLGGRTTAIVSVTPGTSLTVRVGGAGPNGASPPSATAGRFNGGGASEGDGGGGGGASSVHDGTTPLVVVGGGGGGGGAGGATVGSGDGGAGGGLIANFGQIRDRRRWRWPRRQR